MVVISLWLAIIVMGILIAPQYLLALIAVALPALIPPLRRFAHSNYKFRFGLITTIGFIPFIVIFTYLIVGFANAGEFSPYRIFPFEGCFVGELITSGAPEKLIFRELLWRSFVPPPISTLCYSSQDVCSYLACVSNDTGWSLEEYNTWWRYIHKITFAFVPASVSGSFAWLFTRPQNFQKSERIGVRQ